VDLDQFAIAAPDGPAAQLSARLLDLELEGRVRTFARWPLQRSAKGVTIARGIVGVPCSTCWCIVLRELLAARCLPRQRTLTRKLSAVGFESEEIEDALAWLDGLAKGASSDTQAQSAHGMRVYTDAERELLGEDSIGFITFLESSGVLPATMREMVLDRAKAVGEAPIDLDDLKVIVLMVFWSLGEEPERADSRRAVGRPPSSARSTEGQALTQR